MSLRLPWLRRDKKNEGVAQAKESTTKKSFGGATAAETKEVGDATPAPTEAEVKEQVGLAESKEALAEAKTEDDLKVAKDELELPKVEMREGENGDFTKAQLVRVKGWVYEQEKKNFDKIFVFRTPGGKNGQEWWKIGGPSMLYLTNGIDKELELERRTRVDRDNYYEFREGVASVLKIDELKRDLARAGVEVMAESETIVVFRLRKKWMPEELKELRRANAHYKERMGKTLYVVYKFPELETQLRDFAKATHTRMLKDPIPERDYLTRGYADKARQAFVLLRLICEGRMELKTGFKTLATLTDFLAENLYVIAEEDIWDKRTCERLMKIITPAREEVLRKLKENGG